MSEWSLRRLNAIQSIAGAKSYLEIGVFGGATFLGVDLPYKDAVDPLFRFDIREHATELVRFFEMTSDEFFTSGQAYASYDLFFIDGLHTFEQTFRDFTAALSRSHHRSVFLIDDTVPNDVFSSLPDQALALKERGRSGREGDNRWHGDVYKVVLALHDFFPTLEFATIVDTGNPQTLVWHEPRADFRPVLGNFEMISRASYFDLANYAPAFRYATEAEALERLRSAMSPP